MNEFQNLSSIEIVPCDQVPDESSGQNNWSFLCLPGCPEKSSDSGKAAPTAEGSAKQTASV